MATLDKILTSQTPNVLIGTTTIRFDKLVIRKGKIEDLEFLISWKTNVEGKLFSYSQTLRLHGYEDLNTLPSKVVYQFRKTFNVPKFDLGENTGIEIVAMSDSSEPFDLTVYLEIDPM